MIFSYEVSSQVSCMERTSDGPYVSTLRWSYSLFKSPPIGDVRLPSSPLVAQKLSIPLLYQGSIVYRPCRELVVFRPRVLMVLLSVPPTVSSLAPLPIFSNRRHTRSICLSVVSTTICRCWFFFFFLSCLIAFSSCD